MSTAKSGTRHFLEMTISSIALLILMPLFVGTVGPVIGENYEVVTSHFSRPFPAIVSSVTLVVVLLHFKGGVATLIEDYVDGLSRKLWIFIMSFISYISIVIVLLSVARLAL
jgi:succinate dehydrogenase / fumarate reductase membrane anchor subunit